MTAQHEDTDRVCRTADPLVELGAQPAPAGRTPSWAAAGVDEEPGPSDADRNRPEAAEALLDDADAAPRATPGLPR